MSRRIFVMEQCKGRRKTIGRWFNELKCTTMGRCVVRYWYLQWIASCTWSWKTRTQDSKMCRLSLSFHPTSQPRPFNSRIPIHWLSLTILLTVIAPCCWFAKKHNNPLLLYRAVCTWLDGFTVELIWPLLSQVALGFSAGVANYDWRRYCAMKRLLVVA